jgi:hypothetical protein
MSSLNETGSLKMGVTAAPFGLGLLRLLGATSEDDGLARVSGVLGWGRRAAATVPPTSAKCDDGAQIIAEAIFALDRARSEHVEGSPDWTKVGARLTTVERAINVALDRGCFVVSSPRRGPRARG